jgi:hypothetical protein
VGLPDLVKSMIANVVVPVAGPFRAPIQVVPMTGRTAKGPVYGPPEDDVALVENVSETVLDASGTEQVSNAKFTFFTPRPIKEGDRIVLNGVTTAVVKVGGLLDDTGVPYLPEAWTGRASR